jgi:hypothetical protein
MQRAEWLAIRNSYLRLFRGCEGVVGKDGNVTLETAVQPFDAIEMCPHDFHRRQLAADDGFCQ